jgi:hypothetical protein
MTDTASGPGAGNHGNLAGQFEEPFVHAETVPLPYSIQ